MVLKSSDIVLSLSGRDKGKLFMVLEAQDEYVLISDGKFRRIEKPKRKKAKHTLFVCESNAIAAKKIRNGEKVTNSDIRRALSEQVKASHTAD